MQIDSISLHIFMSQEKSLLWFICLFSLTLFCGCSKESDSLQVNVEQIGSIYIYDSVEIKWTVNGKKKSDDTSFQWESQNPDIASVKNGVVTGRYPGTATLSLYLLGNNNEGREDDMLLKSIQLTVMDYSVESILLTPETLSIYSGKQYSLSAVVLPNTTTQQSVSWTSSDNKIAIVSPTGLVTGKKPGTATIRVTSTANPGIFSECALTVNKIDTLKIVTGNKAGSHPIIGGNNPDIPATGTDFLSYSNGMVFWSENNTGQIRHQELVIPATGSKIEVTQIGPEAFKGRWTMKSMKYSGNSNPGVRDVLDVTIAGSTTDDCNLEIKGLYYDAILPAQFTIESEDGPLKIGVLLDERTGHKAYNGKTDYPYVCFVPMCANSISSFGTDNGPYEMAPVPINDSDNNMWLWFYVSDDLNTFSYSATNRQFVPGNGGVGGKPVVGISCLLSKSENPSISDFNDTYTVSYYASRLTSGIIFERQ